MSRDITNVIAYSPYYKARNFINAIEILSNEIKIKNCGDSIELLAISAIENLFKTFIVFHDDKYNIVNRCVDGTWAYGNMGEIKKEYQHNIVKLFTEIQRLDTSILKEIGLNSIEEDLEKNSFIFIFSKEKFSDHLIKQMKNLESNTKNWSLTKDTKILFKKDIEDNYNKLRILNTIVARYGVATKEMNDFNSAFSRLNGELSLEKLLTFLNGLEYAVRKRIKRD